MKAATTIFNRIFCLSLFLCCTGSIYSQNKGELLQSKIEGKETFTEIIQEIDSFYENDFPSLKKSSSDGLPKQKIQKRWEWYVSGRLGPNGELTNIDHLNRNAKKEQNKMNNETDKSAPQSWFQIGPVVSPDLGSFGSGIGRVDRLAFHPTDSNIIYAGTPAGGLWKTTNGGASWAPKSDHLASLAISGIVVTPSSPNTIYILTGDGDASNPNTFVSQFGYARTSVGVYKSTNGGDTWTHLPLPILGDYYGYELIQNPSNLLELFAATSEGLYKTINGGLTWELEVVGNFTDVVYRPGASNVVVAAGTGVIWRTIDSGFSWFLSIIPPAEPLCTNGRIQLAVSPDNSDIMYALAGPVKSGGEFCGLYKSTDAGFGFVRVRNTPNILGQQTNGADSLDQSGYDLAIAANPDDADEIYTGGLTIWRSTNGGTDMNATSGYWASCPSNCPTLCCLTPARYVHPDIHDIKINPLNDAVYAACDGGIWRSYNGGTTWEDISEGLIATQFYHMSGRPGFVHHLYGGAQDNGVKYRKSNSGSFDHVTGGDGFSMASAPNLTHRFYSTVNDVVYRYTASGNSFTRITITPDIVGSGDTMFFKNVIAHPTDISIVIVGAKDIWQTTDATVSWTNRGASGSWALANCPSRPDRFYSAGGDSYNNGAGAVYRSDNAGDTWVNIVNSGFPGSFTKITDIDASPNVSDFVCATFGGFNSGIKVARSVNAGNSWTNISYDLPNVPINCVKFDDALNVYVGTDIGVYYLPHKATSWQFTSTNLPNVPVTDLYIHSETENIYASTFGRGIWAASLVCPTDHNISSTMSGIEIYKASNNVTSTSTVTNSATVFLQAGNKIELLPGFKISTGAFLKAKPKDCTEVIEPVN